MASCQVTAGNAGIGCLPDCAHLFRSQLAACGRGTYMPPSGSMCGTTDCARRYTMFPCQLAIRRTRSSDCPNILFSQDGPTGILAVCFVLPPLVDHVPRIVGRRAQEQMTRVAAGGVVTRMANDKIPRLPSCLQKERHAMGKETPVANSNPPGPSALETARPLPAIIQPSDVYLGPESLYLRGREVRDGF